MQYRIIKLVVGICYDFVKETLTRLVLRKNAPDFHVLFVKLLRLVGMPHA